jgi:hypothetical protein
MKAEDQINGDIIHGKEVERILHRAVQHALLMHKRAGNPIASWQDGKVIIIQPEDIIVEGSSTTDEA